VTRQVSVIVPLYNEAENVPILAARIETALAAMPDVEYECIPVNDGSTDGTHDELERLRQADARIRPIHLLENRGQSAALVAGMRRARGRYILTLDGDLQNDPADLPKLLDLLEQYDCVCGYRVNRQDTRLRRVAGKTANWVRRRFLGGGVRDAGCGTKGFRRCCIEHIVPFNGAHRYLDLMVRNAGLTVVECPVTHHPRLHGVSKYGIHDRLWRGLYDLIGVQWLLRRYVTYRIEGEGE